MGLLKALGFGKLPSGECVVCGQKTYHKSAGRWACDPYEGNNVACATVLVDRDQREAGDYGGFDSYRQESTGTYADYINSYDWQVKADDMRRRAMNKCQRCGRGPRPFRRLQVHHKTYKNLRRERPEDLEVLCEACHRALHGIK